MEYALLIGLMVLVCSLPMIAIWGSVDVFQQPAEVWTAAGCTRSRWAWQAGAVFCLPVVLAYSGMYFFGVRPRLTRARDSLELQYAAAVPLQPRWATDSTMAPTGQIRLRTPLLTILLSVLPLAVVLATVGTFVGPDVLATGVVAAVFSVTAQLRFGVTLIEHEVIVSNFRRTHIRWTDIAAITERRFMGARRVFLLLSDGSRIALRYPVLPFPWAGRRRYEQEFDILSEWWLTNRRPSAGPFD